MPTPVRPRRPAARTREHVLDVAAELFYWRGIRATGVDVVAREAGIAPTTLYRLFRAKEDLVAAYVDRAAVAYRQRFDAAAATGVDPRAAVEAVFDALVEEVDPARCRGCLFLLALAETPDAAQPAHHGVLALKAWVRTRLGELAGAFVSDPRAAEVLAADLALVMEGVYASVQVSRDVEPAVRARRMVGTLLDGAGR